MNDNQGTNEWDGDEGIDEDNINQLIELGVSRVAVSNAVIAAEDPGVAVQAIKSRLHQPDIQKKAGVESSP